MDEIQLISDGDGLAVLGEPAAVERFLANEGLPSKSLDLPRLSNVLSTASGAAQAGSEISANSARWVKLTEDSAQAVKKFGLRESKKTGLSTGVVKGDKGQVKGFVEFVKGPGTLVNNPAILAGAAGMMAQLAMQQTMNEITDYLATIEAKVDDVLRAQKDSVLARMIGIGFVVEEAMTIRDSRGRVDEVTWSKVQSAPATIAETQAYALRQLDALAERLERKKRIRDLAEEGDEARAKTEEWLAVLARCFQLQDAIAVLELDRVLDASPEELDGHRLGLHAARQGRLDQIARTTDRLMARMVSAAGKANSKVLTHPSKAPEIVASGSQVSASIDEFHERLGIERGGASLEARRWSEAATDVGAKAFETGAEGVDVARRIGSGAWSQARSVTGRLSNRVAERRRTGVHEDGASVDDD